MVFDSECIHPLSVHKKNLILKNPGCSYTSSYYWGSMWRITYYLYLSFVQPLFYLVNFF